MRRDAHVTKPINLDDFDRVVIEIRNLYGHVAALPHRSPDEPATADPPCHSAGNG